MLQLEERLQPLACAVLANGQPRHVRLALWELTHAIQRDCPDAIPLLIAPFLSPASQALCKEHKVAFLDQQGNARLVFDGVFIERVAAGKPASVRRDLKSLFTPKAAQVLRLLLRDPWRPWRVTELAGKAEVSLGQVSNVRRGLLDREWATVTEEGLALKDPDALLDEWSEAYAGLGGKKNSYYTTLHGKGLEDAFLELFRDQRDRPGVLLASFTAAKWLAPYGRIATHNLLSQPAELEHLHKTLALQPAVNGANVVVTMPDHEGVFLDAVHPSPGIGFIVRGIFPLVIGVDEFRSGIGAVVVYLGNHAELIGVLQVEEQLDGSLATIHLNRLTANHSGEGGEPLLAIEQELGFGVGIGLLAHREGLLGHRLIGFPDQDGARGIGAI